MTRPGRTPECLSALRLVQLDARELDSAALTTGRAHADGCARCGAALEALAAEKAAFAAAPTPLWMARARREQTSRGSVLAIVGVVVAIAAGVFLIVAPQHRSDTKASPDQRDTRIKGGGIALRVFAQRDGTAHALAAGDVVHPGERLRFTLRGHALAHVAVFSLDGAGAASIYVPTDSSDLVLELSSEANELPGAIELDDTLGTEALFGLACRDAVDLETVRMALARDHALTPPVGCDVDRVTLSKTEAQP